MQIFETYMFYKKCTVLDRKDCSYPDRNLEKGGKGTDGYGKGTNLPGIAGALWLRGRGISALCSELRKVRTLFGCSTALGKCLGQWISSFSAVGRDTLFFRKIIEKSSFLSAEYEKLRNPPDFLGVRKPFPICSICFLSGSQGLFCLCGCLILAKPGSCLHRGKT